MGSGKWEVGLSVGESGKLTSKLVGGAIWTLKRGRDGEVDPKTGGTWEFEIPIILPLMFEKVDIPQTRLKYLFRQEGEAKQIHAYPSTP